MRNPSFGSWGPEDEQDISDYEKGSYYSNNDTTNLQEDGTAYDEYDELEEDLDEEVDTETYLEEDTSYDDYDEDSNPVDPDSWRSWMLFKVIYGN